MTTYTDELNAELERVTLRGNPDKKTIQKLASIIWRLDTRLTALEAEVVLDDKPAEPAAPAKPAEKETKSTSTRRVAEKNKEDE